MRRNSSGTPGSAARVVGRPFARRDEALGGHAGIGLIDGHGPRQVRQRPPALAPAQDQPHARDQPEGDGAARRAEQHRLGEPPRRRRAGGRRILLEERLLAIAQGGIEGHLDDGHLVAARLVVPDGAHHEAPDLLELLGTARRRLPDVLLVRALGHARRRVQRGRPPTGAGSRPGSSACARRSATARS